MHRLGRSLAFVAALGAVSSLGGCVKLRERTVVMPDGAGRFTLTVGFGEEFAELIEKSKEAGKPSPVPQGVEEIQKNFEGFVAFLPPETKKSDDGWTYMTVTGYFEDANKVKVYGDKRGERQLMLTLSWKKAEDGSATLTADSRMFQDAAESGGMEGADEVPPEMAEQMKAMFEGFEMSEEYELPGDVASVENLPTKAGRTASLKLTVDELLDPKKAREAVQAGARVIRCGPSKVTEDEVKAFAEEMKKAKAEWKRMVDEHERAKALGEGEKPAEKPADGGEQK